MGQPAGRELEPEVFGELAGHPRAAQFAREVLRVHRRYAEEIVLRYGLCPFLREADTGFGRFCVMLDRAPHAGRAGEAAAGAAGVVHLVFPCAGMAAVPFERFAYSLIDSVKRACDTAPVMAVFHPELSGDSTAPHRLVGMLRRAPDPFIQLVPEGLHQGGTVFAGAMDELVPDPARTNFDRLAGGELDRLLGLLAEIHADRAKSYAPYLEAFADSHDR